MSLRMFAKGLWEANRPGEQMEGRGHAPTVYHQLVSAEGWIHGLGQKSWPLRSQWGLLLQKPCGVGPNTLQGDQQVRKPCGIGPNTLQRGQQVLYVGKLTHELLSFLRKPQSLKGKSSICSPSI